MSGASGKGCVTLVDFFQDGVPLYLEQVRPVPLFEGHIA